MNKLNKNNKGFTLIELLVVIAIIAILAIVGLVLFNGQQASARDSRRRADIDSIVQALEGNYNPTTGQYAVLAANQFAGNVIPTDTCGDQYAVASSAVVGAAIPTVPTAWTNCVVATPLPTTPGGYQIVSITQPVALARVWTVCARLESGAGVNVYCRSNSR